MNIYNWIPDIIPNSNDVQTVVLVIYSSVIMFTLGGAWFTRFTFIFRIFLSPPLFYHAYQFVFLSEENGWSL